MLHWYHPLRPLRSAAYPLLVPNKNKTVKFGRRLCDTATAAVLWNNIPAHLRCAESVWYGMVIVYLTKSKARCNIIVNI